MVISVSNQGKTQTIGHIMFPYSPVIAAIFLKEVPSNQKDIFFDGKKITTQQVSKKLEKLLIEKGFTLHKTNKKVLEGRDKVCGIPISTSKNYKGKEIKELLVVIKASSPEELAEKKKILISGIQKWMPNIKYKQSTADKFVRC